MMRNFFQFGPTGHLAADDEMMEMDLDPDDALAIMDALGEHAQEKLLDADFFNGMYRGYIIPIINAVIE